MVVFGETHGDTNVIHIIIGEETEFQFDLTGQSIMDITDQIKGMQDAKKCVLLINRCNNETDTVAQLQERQLQHKAKFAMDQLDKVLEDGSDKSKKKTFTASDLKCPNCKAPDSANVINGVATICDSCKEIAAGILKKNKTKTEVEMPKNQEISEISKKILPKKKKGKGFFGMFNDTPESEDPT